jgi:hypothetical protein
MKLKKWHKILIVLALVGGTAGFIVWKWANRPVRDFKNVTPKENFTMQTIMQKLGNADSGVLSKYLDRNYLVAVSGKVKDFIPSDSAAIINIGDENTPGIIQCQMDARHNEDVAGLHIGDSVIVKGVVAGLKKQEAGDAISELLGDASLGTDIVMNFCILVKKTSKK